MNIIKRERKGDVIANELHRIVFASAAGEHRISSHLVLVYTSMHTHPFTNNSQVAVSCFRRASLFAISFPHAVSTSSFKFECIFDRNMGNMKFGAMATTTSSNHVTSTLLLRLTDMTRLQRRHSLSFQRCSGCNSGQPARPAIIVWIASFVYAY